MSLMLTGRGCKNSITNGWGKRDRNLPTTINSKKRFGKSIAND